MFLLVPIKSQHTNALDRAVSDSTIAVPMLRPVRPVGVTGQTGSPVQNSEIRRMLALEGPRQGKRA